MNCEIIKDLLPLYIDKVCSKQTESVVEAHLKTCPHCKQVYKDMIQQVIKTVPVSDPPPEKNVYLRIRRKLGNMLLCAILFIAFIGLCFGMMNEIGSHGWQQGLFAMIFVVPCTAFLISMGSTVLFNRISYRPWFRWISAGITLLICIGGELYALDHYQAEPESYRFLPFCIGIVLIFTLLSFFISSLYSRFCRR